MKSFVRFAAAALTTSIAASSALAANTLLTNPATTAYVNSTTNVALYESPTGMLIPGRCNLYAQSFANARAAGAEILAYVNVIDRPDNLNSCAPEQDLYEDVGANLWPWPTYGERINWSGTHIADIRAGSAWSDHAVAYVEQLMREDRVDGVFLDVVGGRLWNPNANWASWPQSERDAYTAGTVDFVRRLDALRRAINPRFIVVNNNNWDRQTGPSDPLNFAGEPYVDGVSIEGHFATEPYQIAYANKAFGNLGHRRVIAFGRNPQDAQDWEDIQGVTHVIDTAVDYLTASPPIVPFNRLTDRPKTFGQTTPGTGMTGGMDGDFKRASKFTLGAGGRLVALHAYLDGGGGGAGSQGVRLVLYRDNAGVPGAEVVESTAKTISAGAAASWQKFTVSNVALTAGTYWIAIHTGLPASVIRAGRTTTPNWYGANDLFTDGAANPYGPGYTQPVTLSVHATYTVE